MHVLKREPLRARSSQKTGHLNFCIRGSLHRRVDRGRGPGVRRQGRPHLHPSPCRLVSHGYTTCVERIVSEPSQVHAGQTESRSARFSRRATHSLGNLSPKCCHCFCPGTGGDCQAGSYYRVNRNHDV